MNKPKHCVSELTQVDSEPVSDLTHKEPVVLRAQRLIRVRRMNREEFGTDWALKNAEEVPCEVEKEPQFTSDGIPIRYGYRLINDDEVKALVEQKRFERATELECDENRYKEELEERLVNEERQRDMDSYCNEFWKNAESL